jgi:hypothetical protein
LLITYCRLDSGRVFVYLPATNFSGTMQKLTITLLFLSFSFSIFAQQKEIPCTDLKVMLDDALAKHHDDKGVLIGTNEYTGITEYKYHLDLSSWAVSCAIKEMEFEKGKVKSWGEILVHEGNNKDSVLTYAKFVKAEMQDCWKYGIDKTEKAGTEGRDFSFVFMVHNQASWTDIELFVNHTGEEYHVYIIF